ncbi:L-arabinose-binding protein [Arthrobacter alpinus]|uniref:L-arabinose-binding protein n=1 Tax=Arthrobacter alpinus TaxID=656366 RepID=A0A1H5IFH0_9MICC|nr:ABC transporter substrate-binding protein [Arthrobacter alpinus]SEE38824.1 L-arabinose-binding protein [Arthrobacter alpinus]
MKKSHLSRRDLLRIGTIAGGSSLLAALVGGCGNSSPAAVNGGAVDLSMWTHDDGYIKFFESSLPAVNAGSKFSTALAFTKIGSSDIVTKLIAQAVAGRGTPDVAGLEIGQFARLLNGDLADELLVDLSDVAAEFGNDLIQARTAPFSKNGKLFALDSDTPLAVYYHREDRFRELGIPTDLATWEELAQVAGQANKKHGVSFGALATGTDLPQVVQSFQIPLVQRGGNLFDKNGELTIETPEAEEVLSFLSKSVQSGVYTTVSDYYGAGMQAALKSNNLLGVAMPSWYAAYGIVPNVPEQTGKWRIRALPQFSGGGGRTSVGGGTGFAAVRGKANSVAAVELIKVAYLSKAQQVQRYKQLGYLPTLRSVFDDPELHALGNEYFGGQRLFEVYSDIIDDVPEIYQSGNQMILNTVLSGYLLRAYNGDLTPSQALTAAARDFRGQTRN